MLISSVAFFHYGYMIKRESNLTHMNEHKNDRVQPLYRGTQVIWYIFYIIETLLLFRFILKLLGANPAAGFTQFIYGITAPFVAPFIAVFRSIQVSITTIEWSTLLAMLVYWLLAWAIVKLLVMGRPVNNREAKYHLREQEGPRGV